MNVIHSVTTVLFERRRKETKNTYLVVCIMEAPLLH